MTARPVPRPLPVTVVMPVRDQAAQARAAVTALLDATPRPAEIIVVDAGSTDGLAEAMCRLPVRVLHHTAIGPWAARTAGALAARQPHIVFLDPGDRLDTGLLARWDARITEEPPPPDLAAWSAFPGGPAWADDPYAALLRGPEPRPGDVVWSRRALVVAGGFQGLPEPAAMRIRLLAFARAGLLAPLEGPPVLRGGSPSGAREGRSTAEDRLALLLAVAAERQAAGADADLDRKLRRTAWRALWVPTAREPLSGPEVPATAIIRAAMAAMAPRRRVSIVRANPHSSAEPSPLRQGTRY